MMIALVALVGLCAAGLGGYEPWATFILELGAALLALVFVLHETWFAPRDERDKRAERARHGAWKRLPFALRHPGLSSALRLASFGLVKPRSSAGVELVIATGDGRQVELDLSEDGFFLGIPFRRSGLFWPLGLMAIWIALSLVPLPQAWLAMVSPAAHAARAEVASLLDRVTDEAWPASLVPFLTARDLWIWLAVVALFITAAVLVRREERNAVRLGVSVLVLGSVSGIYGLAGWLEGLSESFGVASQSLRARGSFGNANHYAMFQGMMVLTGLGLVGFLQRLPRPRKGARSEGGAQVLVAAIGVVLAALGLVLSLSRSGITFVLAAAMVFVLLVGGESRRRSMTPYVAVGLAVLALVAWLGIEPLVARFGDIGEQLDREGTRVLVWADSKKGIGDFWLTGSGLASFRYVGTHYRTFPGNVYFSWAHNDYLQLAIELGLPGVLLLGVIVASFLVSIRRARAGLVLEPARAALHAGFVSALVFAALHSATDFGLHMPANLALLALVAAGTVSPRGFDGS